MELQMRRHLSSIHREEVSERNTLEPVILALKAWGEMSKARGWTASTPPH